jgi:hypothetical protein
VGVTINMIGSLAEFIPVDNERVFEEVRVG